MNDVNVLLDKIATLRGIHKDSATMAHAILRNKDDDWQPYIPTHFVYAFLTFNTLYNFDWEQSLQRGELCEFDELNERDKIYKYISFCCGDKNFCRIYKTFFLRYVTQCYCKEKILEEFEKITSDSWIKDGLLQGFLQVCQECLAGQLNLYIVNKIAFFIYKIRCNLFHGKKTLEDLKNEEQQTRLEIYSMFLIAINQMIFSYLEYKKSGNGIENSFDSLLRTLKWNKIEINTSQNNDMDDLSMEGDV